MAAGLEKGRGEGIKSYYKQKIEENEVSLAAKIQNLRRLEAQRNELNSRGQYILNSVCGAL